MRLRRLYTCFALLTCVSLSGCSLFPPPVSNLEHDDSAKVTLDYKANRVIKPLDEYLHYGIPDYRKEAYDLLMRTCFRKYNLDFKSADLGIDGTGREYGMWNPEYTQKYGYLDRDKTTKVEGGIKEHFSECQQYSYTELDKVSVRQHLTFAEDLSMKARAAAKTRPEWKQTKDEWRRCLKDQGLTPPEQDSGVWTKEGEGVMIRETLTDEEVRLATLEAECAQKTQLAQKLGDLEASYQLPLIRNNESQLKEELKAYRATDDLYKQFIASFQENS